MPERLAALTTWLMEILSETGASSLPSSDFQIAPASADASFRRYFRVAGPAVVNAFSASSGSLIVMDAPPDKEDIHPFVVISKLLIDAGLNVPQVFAEDFNQGFLLLSDLGAKVYLDVLDENTVEPLYADALDALLQMQRNVSTDATSLPAFDATLLWNEMVLFRDWYCEQYRQFTFSQAQRVELEAVFQQLTASALAQPQVFVHRDYHSRNLMVMEQNNPGILDFQDAVIGPLTYDLVSLLRDCYIAWPRQRVEQWALAYLHRAADAGVFEPQSNATYLRWFDWMGVQRHLKATGIFARLHLRDNKPAYLNDIPRTLGYVRDVSARYPELQSLHALLADLED
jgi:aminoglycoside/choline kinase family phosphotransferase